MPIHEAPPPLRIGIDLGGTKIEGLLLGPAGKEMRRLRVASPSGDYGATLQAIAGVVAELLSEMPPETACDVPVGIGMPGSISPKTGLVQNANSTWLNGKPLDKDLASVLRRPLRFANDANCFALSEAVDGAGAGAVCVFGVILGTGVGGGIVHSGRLQDGPRASSGEWGHNPLPWPEPDEYPGPGCWCGRSGCLEAWISGPGLAADHHQVTGEALKPTEIAERAANGDTGCASTLKRHASRLARGLAHVVNIVDPDVIVLGGGLSLMPHLYRDLPGLIAPHLFTDAPYIDVRPPRWGDAGGARGAAWLWP